MRSIIEGLKGKDIWWGLLSLIILAALIAFGAVSYIKGTNLDNISLIVGGLMTNLGLLLNYRYGSSKGSKDKTELLGKQGPQEPRP